MVEGIVRFDVDWPERNKAVLRSLGLDEGLATGFGGALIPRDASSTEYNTLRALHDPAFDAFPTLIAICPSPDSVRIAMTIARAGRWPVVCRSGGHSTAGYSSRDDAMVIDLRMMTHLAIDGAGDVARFGAGLDFYRINTVLGAYDRHVPGGACSTVCVGGFMQGGGYGFTSRIFGMNIDNVRSFRMMLADWADRGRVASAELRPVLGRPGRHGQ